jgi:hypothetical protein
MGSLLMKLNRLGVPEYSEDYLNTFLVLFFLTVPVFAVVTVIYTVMYNNGVFRMITASFVDWDKYDETQIKRKKKPQEPRPSGLNKTHREVRFSFFFRAVKFILFSFGTR